MCGGVRVRVLAVRVRRLRRQRRRRVAQSPPSVRGLGAAAITENLLDVKQGDRFGLRRPQQQPVAQQPCRPHRHPCAAFVARSGIRRTPGIPRCPPPPYSRPSKPAAQYHITRSLAPPYSLHHRSSSRPPATSAPGESIISANTNTHLDVLNNIYNRMCL